MKIVDTLQGLGRALMLPIAVLPVAGILLRLGQEDIAGPIQAVLPFLHLGFLAAAGGAIFDNLGLLFAIGAAVGFARDNHGAAGLAGVVSFLVATSGAKTLLLVPPSVTAGLSPHLADLAAADFRAGAIHDLSVPMGILSGVLAGACYNRYATIKVPEYLAFFGGRRFVPIAMGLMGAGLALVFGASYGALHGALLSLSKAVVGAGGAGLFFYGALNRLLIVTGLHHILNNIAWFIIGDYHGSTGDLKRFFAGDPSAGGFMAGFFPVMMFGLPAACLAMYHAAPKARRPEIGGMFISMALTSFLTGVTEPIEFTFMFLAPALYAAHIVLTGLAFVIMNVLGVKLGFSFSAGLFDYLINFGLSTRPLLLIPVGAVYFALYYLVFRVVISALNLQTPGRAPVDEVSGLALQATDRASGFVEALGGAANIQTLDACTTRLRLTVQDQAKVDEAALRRLGARGVVRPSSTAVQVILGPIADLVASEMRAVVDRPATPVAAAIDSDKAPSDIEVRVLIDALGGQANLVQAKAASTRLIIDLRADALASPEALKAAGVRASAQVKKGRWHLIVGAGAPALAKALNA